MIDLVLGVLTLPFALAIGGALLGGLMHGYTGWGGGMVMIPLFSLLFGPVEALAITAFGGVMVAAQIYPAALRITQWRDSLPLSVGVLILTPIGALLLLNTDPELVRRFIGFAVIAATLLLLSGWRYKGNRGPWAGGVFGGLSGFVNGFSGIGGPIVVIYVMALPDDAAVQRANIVVVSGLTIFIIMITLGLGGGISAETLVRGLLLGPVQMVGGWVGAQLFRIAPQDIFRRVTLGLLILLGVTVILL